MSLLALRSLRLNYLNLGSRSFISVRLSSDISPRPPKGFKFGLRRPKSEEPKIKGRKSYGKYFFLLLPAATFALGIWQLKRLPWKQELILKVKSRMTMAPALIDSVESLRLAIESPEWEYRRVRLRGRFEHSREIQLMMRTYVEAEDEYANLHERFLAGPLGKGGALVVTPFRLSDPPYCTMLVNRGWVVAKHANPQTRPAPVPPADEEVELLGVVRRTEVQTRLGPRNNFESGELVRRDVEAFARLLGAAPLWVDADRSFYAPGQPIGGQTHVGLQNPHLNYAITWFACTGIGLVLWSWL